MNANTVRRIAGSDVTWGALAAGGGVVGGVVACAVLGDLHSARTFLVVAAALLACAAVGVILVRPWTGVPAMLAVLPLDTAGRIIDHPVTLTVFHVVLFLSLGSWVVHVALRRERFRFSWMDAGLALLVLAAIWSLPHSLNPGATRFAVVRLVFLWLFTLFVANHADTRARVSATFWVLLGTGAFMGAFALAQAYVPGFTFGNVHAQGPVGDQLLRPAAFFDDPNYLGGFLSCAALVGAGLTVHARKVLPGVAAAGLGLVAAGGVLVTYSRTAWVGLAVGLVVIAITAPRGRRGWLIGTGLIGVLLVAALGSGAITKRVTTSLASEDNSVNTRVLMFESTVNMIRDDWVYGAGLGAFDRRYLQYRRTGSLFDILRPHQVPLALWAETGVVGLIAEIALMVALAALFWRAARRGWGVASAIAAAGVASFLTQSLFQYYLYFEYVWLFFALSVIAAGGAMSKEES